MTRFRRLAEITERGLRALVRVDFNVPTREGRVSDDTRLRAAVPTIRALQAKGCRVALCAHFDRPKGKRVPEMSLAPVRPALEALLGERIVFVDDCIGEAAERAVAGLSEGGVALLENTRFHAGEEGNDPVFAAALARVADIYVNDAFSAAHRAHASTEGVARLLPAFPGLSMEQELTYLARALEQPERPVLGVVGGSKVSTKIELLQNLVRKLDKLAIGGGMANTFLAAQGHPIGASMAEADQAETARRIVQLAAESGCELLLPIDITVAERPAAGEAVRTRGLGQLDSDEKILDAGPQTVARLKRAMDQARTLVWNGPLGVFEVAPFDEGTTNAARHAAILARQGKLVAVAGGGDTVAALNHAGVVQDFTFISTAGGAFLEWLEGKTLPGVAALAVPA